ncbi:hypothetical protein FGIG_09319 [Fasciola gigantica]|uniref:DUF5641 domain-containing protein n=1 Tax=Fasciola gigantica TaxID=46835 RepID=A0A504ZAV5_FASGI|nr:hypothetical protein FGIG_09319 [Fasciola gigantica]
MGKTDPVCEENSLFHLSEADIFGRKIDYNNSRSRKELRNLPLVPVTSDAKDDYALTPRHIPSLRGNTGMNHDGNQGGLYTKRRPKVIHLAVALWRRWTENYVPPPRKRQNWIPNDRSLKVGGLVMAASDIGPSKQWPLGIVVESKPSDDGLVRLVSIRT